MKFDDLLDQDASKLVGYSNSELLLLTRFTRFDLHPDYIIAAEEELAKRTVSNLDIEAYKKMEAVEIKRANAVEQWAKRIEHYGTKGMVCMLVTYLLFMTLYMAFFGLFFYALGIYYIGNSKYRFMTKLFCIASPLILTAITIKIYMIIY